MQETTVNLRTLLWYENKEITLSFPPQWNLNIYHMEGYNNRQLNEKEIKLAFSKTIGSKRICDLAKTRKEAVIIFDDMTRPTPVYLLVPHILEELNKGGITDDHIRFISALGSHAPMDREDLVKKLGENIVEEFPVFNHNPFGNLTDIGMTTRETPVKINREVMSCDLKIGVGLVCPHGMSGFGGGAKIILPGVSSIDTILANHKLLPMKWGITEGVPLFQDMNEAARMASLDIKVDTIVNGRANITSLYVGDFVAEHREAVKMAKSVYNIPIQKKYDIVVANAYLKHNEVPLTIRLIKRVIKNGGTAVIIDNEPKGPVWHYLEGKFGKKFGGPFCALSRNLNGVGKVIIYSQYKLKDPWYPLYEPDQQIWIKDWKEVIEELRNIYKDKANVAVIPEASIAIPRTLLN
ncbi:lactate racemase domain-containing protein [Thermoproteota archaeon]